MIFVIVASFISLIKIYRCPVCCEGFQMLVVGSACVSSTTLDRARYVNYETQQCDEKFTKVDVSENIVNQENLNLVMEALGVLKIRLFLLNMKHHNLTKNSQRLTHSKTSSTKKTWRCTLIRNA